jgi:hypothetical protein
LSEAGSTCVIVSPAVSGDTSGLSSGVMLMFRDEARENTAPPPRAEEL